MLQFLKKIVFDILPSVVATIVGAYIVHHYVIPAATPKPDAATVAPAEAKATPDAGAPAEKPSFVKGVAEKAAIEKTATEKAGGETAASESKKRHAAPRATKPASAATDQTASLPESPAEERRDANGLARAAIDRLRPPATEAPRTVAVAPAQTPLAQTPPAQTPMPPLPPAVTLPPSAEVFNSGTGAIVAPARPMPPVAPTRSADASRPLPPENIPAPPPLELHDDIATSTGNRAAAVADDVVSAAKSVFHAVLPLK